MCGIVGYVGNRPVVDLLLKGLKRLEYRGYDSAGIAVLHGGSFEIRKSEGRLENVESLLNGSTSAELKKSTVGMGHTRWATHGKPTTQNAHPHRAGHVVLVHNGIIENYQEIRDELLSRGHKPQSETDSELFGFLVLEEMDRGVKLVDAVRRSFLRLHGACSFVVMSEREPGVVVGVRNGSPLVATVDPEGGGILASDAQPLIEYNRRVTYLENGDLAILTAAGVEVLDIKSGQPVKRSEVQLDFSADSLDKQGYAHYMLKEIHEQPTALVDTLNGTLDRATAQPFPLAQQPGVKLLLEARELTIVACGTSYYAAMVGKYWLEKWARIPVSVELASEYRYRDPVVTPGGLLVGLSQSGETADTLAVIRDSKRRGVSTLGVTNVRGSTLSREADATFFTSAGPEIGVAATKTFFSQMLMFLLWSGQIGIMRERRGENLKKLGELFQNLIKLPHQIKEMLGSESEAQGLMRDVKAAAQAFQSLKGFFFIGRGFSYPLALEGALKLKEIAYVHAEGYAAGELKHGPIAMLSSEMAVVVLAPRDAWHDKTVSNLEEAKARGAKILGIGDAKDTALQRLCDQWIPLPGRVDENLLPFVLAPVVQLFAYELAVLKGTDVDKPRNLAKSVTVE